MAITFDWLIHPITPEVFFRDYYEKKPLLIRREDRKTYLPLLSIADIDRQLATTVNCYPDIFMVDSTRELSPDKYTFEGSSPPNRLDLPRIYELFRTGATISLSHLHDRHAPLAELCRACEHVFSAPFQTNIYLTPPNAQGFKIHWDSHDVFVLQCEGTKEWHVYDTGVELPLHGMKFNPEKDKNGAETQVFTINPGDLFYIPRGLFHAARSTDSTSLHITLGLIATTWADVVMEALAKVCTEDVAFRPNLPVGFMAPGFDRRAMEAKFRTLLETFAKKAELGPVIDRFASDFVSSRWVELGGGLKEVAQPSAITAASRFRSRPHLVYTLKTEGENAIVLFGSSKITMPAFTHDAIARALTGPAFAVRELPPPLDEDGKVVLVRRLLREGLLMAA